MTERARYLMPQQIRNLPRSEQCQTVAGKKNILELTMLVLISGHLSLSNSLVCVCVCVCVRARARVCVRTFVCVCARARVRACVCA